MSKRPYEDPKPIPIDTSSSVDCKETQTPCSLAKKRCIECKQYGYVCTPVPKDGIKIHNVKLEHVGTIAQPLNPEEQGVCLPDKELRDGINPYLSEYVLAEVDGYWTYVVRCKYDDFKQKDIFSDCTTIDVCGPSFAIRNKINKKIYQYDARDIDFNPMEYGECVCSEHGMIPTPGVLKCQKEIIGRVKPIAPNINCQYPHLMSTQSKDLLRVGYKQETVSWLNKIAATCVPIPCTVYAASTDKNVVFNESNVYVEGAGCYCGQDVPVYIDEMGDGNAVRDDGKYNGCVYYGRDSHPEAYHYNFSYVGENGEAEYVIHGIDAEVKKPYVVNLTRKLPASANAKSGIKERRFISNIFFEGLQKWTSNFNTRLYDILEKNVPPLISAIMPAREATLFLGERAWFIDVQKANVLQYVLDMNGFIQFTEDDFGKVTHYDEGDVIAFTDPYNYGTLTSHSRPQRRPPHYMGVINAAKNFIYSNPTYFNFETPIISIDDLKIIPYKSDYQNSVDWRSQYWRIQSKYMN